MKPIHTNILRQAEIREAMKICYGDYDYKLLKKALTDYYKPENPVEEVLVDRIAILDWRLKRSVMAERKSVHSMPGGETYIPHAEAMERILRYDRTTDRELHRAIAALEQIRSKKIKNDAAPTQNSTDSHSNGDEPGPDNDLKKGSYDLNKGSIDLKKESYDPLMITQFEVTLETLFSSTTRVRLLKLFLLDPQVKFYQREISARAGACLGPVQREITRLSYAGILVKESSGHQTYYRINDNHPFTPGLRSIFTKLTANTVTTEEGAGDSE